MSARESTGETLGYLGPGLVVRGRVSGTGDLRCDGTLEGSVSLEGALAVGGRLVGPVRAQALAVEGTVQGSVTAGELNVLAGGRLVGDVRATRIGLDDGGSIEGMVDMDVELPPMDGAR